VIGRDVGRDRRNVKPAAAPPRTNILCCHSEDIPEACARRSYNPSRSPAIRKCPFASVRTACGVLPSAVCQKTWAAATGAPLLLSTIPPRMPSIVLPYARAVAIKRTKIAAVTLGLSMVRPHKPPLHLFYRGGGGAGEPRNQRVNALELRPLSEFGRCSCGLRCVWLLWRLLGRPKED
jgi:hypothetical protein